MTFVLTDTHRNRAETMGTFHAEAEIIQGVTHPREILFEEEDIRGVVWSITTVKLEPDSDDAQELIRIYEDAYYERWEH